MITGQTEPRYGASYGRDGEMGVRLALGGRSQATGGRGVARGHGAAPRWVGAGKLLAPKEVS